MTPAAQRASSDDEDSGGGAVALLPEGLPVDGAAVAVAAAAAAQAVRRRLARRVDLDFGPRPCAGGADDAAAPTLRA